MWQEAGANAAGLRAGKTPVFYFTPVSVVQQSMQPLHSFLPSASNPKAAHVSGSGVSKYVFEHHSLQQQVLCMMNDQQLVMKNERQHRSRVVSIDSCLLDRDWSVSIGCYFCIATFWQCATCFYCATVCSEMNIDHLSQQYY